MYKREVVSIDDSRDLQAQILSHHGFRFVEVTGYPGKPSLSALEGRVVHDDVGSAGDFTCSNPLLNRIYQNIVWGVSGNYRSISTDCPQRDERAGWTGDAQVFMKTACLNMNAPAFYTKWLDDLCVGCRAFGIGVTQVIL